VAADVDRQRGHQLREAVQAAALSAAAGGPAPVVTGEFRRGDVRHVFASVARAREVLGFAASVGLEDGMAEFATAPLRAPARA